jgi:alkaline phosphatase D
MAAAIDRRQLLGLATSLAGALWLPRSAWSQVRFTSDPFALGVASGSPTHEGVVLWTRLVQSGDALPPQDVTVGWEVAHDAQFAQVVASGQTTASAALAHSVHAEVQGLAPDRWYFYRFMAGSAVSATGRTRTFPAPGARANKLRLAYASCQHWEHGYFSAYRYMLTEDLDAVMFLGDYIYEYTGSSKGARRVPASATVTLDEYRARYALYKSDMDLQRMHRACPWLMTWDDHEVQNDYAGNTPGDKGPAVADFAARRAAAYQAYYEHMPLRASVLTQALGGLAHGAAMRMYGKVAYGNLATLYLLDDRQHRDPQACTKGGGFGSSTVNPEHCAVWNAPSRTLLGPLQEQWLNQSFGTDKAVWNVLGQQTVFGQRDLKPGAGQVLSNDGWDGYAPARARLTGAMQRHKLANPVILGGDVHSNWVGHVKADYARPDSAAIGVEFCGTSITSHGGSNERLASVLAENPHFVLADRERRGYGVVEFTPKKLTTTLRVVEDVARQDSGIETLASFTVQRGRPVLERG